MEKKYKKMGKLQEKNGQYTLTISKELIKLHNWKKGDEIVPSSDQYVKDIILRKI